jgi:transcriptional antiterminator RfaH
MSLDSKFIADWYCVQCKPNREKYAQLHLERQGFETYLPFVRIQKTIRKKIEWVNRPMFSRYLFLKETADLIPSKIRSTLGVSKLVIFGIKPAKVPDTIIEDIKSHCLEGDDLMLIDGTRLKEGCSVKVLNGPYQGIEAIFCRYTNDQDRIVILMEMMQSLVEVEITRNIIEKN